MKFNSKNIIYSHLFNYYKRKNNFEIYIVQFFGIFLRMLPRLLLVQSESFFLDIFWCTLQNCFLKDFFSFFLNVEGLAKDNFCKILVKTKGEGSQENMS